MNEALQTLVQFGLTNTEAEVFLAITGMGAGTTKELSEAAGKERAQTHHALRRLQMLGIVEVIMDHPTRFKSINVKDAVEQLTLIQADRVHKLVELKESLIEQITSSSPQLIEKPDTYSIVTGRTNTYLKMIGAVKASKKSVSLLLSANGLTRVAKVENFAEALAERHASGISIRILTEITGANLAAVKKFERISELRHIRNQVANASTYDGKISSIALSLHDDLKTESNTHIAIWTNSESFLTTLNNFFDSVWFVAEQSEIASKVAKEDLHN